MLAVFIFCLLYILYLLRHSRAPQSNEYPNPLIIIRNLQSRARVSSSTRNASQIILDKFHYFVRSPNTSISADQAPDFSNGEIPSPEFRLSPSLLGKHDAQHSTQDSRPPVLTPKAILPSCSGAITGRSQRDRFKHEDPYDYPPSPRPIESAVATLGQGVSQTLHEADTASFADPAESVAENQLILDDPEDLSGGESSHAESCVPETRSETESEKGCPLTKEGSEAGDRPPSCKTMKGQLFLASPIFTTAIKEMKMLTLFKQRNQLKDPMELKDTTGTSDLSLEEEQELEQEKASPNSVARKTQESSAQPEDIPNKEKVSLIKNVTGENSPKVLERRDYTDSDERREKENEIEGEEAEREVVE